MVDAGKMIGPLPAGAWVAVVGGGVGIVWYSRRHPKAAPIAVDNTNGLPGVGVGPAGFVAVTSSPASTDNSTISTNDQWATAAITYLIGQGYEPTMADAAIRNYINGVATTTQQQALVDIAMKKFGAPPQTLSPPTANPTPVVPPYLPPVEVPHPVTNQPPPPPQQAPQPPPPPPMRLRYVVVMPWPAQESTLWGIAQQIYGNGTKWSDIYNANRAGGTRPDGSHGWINNPNLLFAGRTVYVP